MEILVLNTNFETVYIVDSFKSMIWTDRYNEYGDFEIYLTLTNNFDIFKYLKRIITYG